jgi:hypothetical protein
MNGTTQVQPGTAYLNGRMTGIAASGFDPAYLTTVQNLVTFGARVGSFATSSWSGTTGGLGWKPKYDDTAGTTTTTTATPPVTTTTGDGDGKAVDLQLVDAAAPALGIASNPAFTQFTTQRITYAAVDNKSGVASYDVRWNRATTSGAVSQWYYYTAWQGTTATSQVLTGMYTGYTYCFSVRARDKVGNITQWSVPLCTAKMFDDRAFTATANWTRPTGKSGYYFSSYSQSKTLNAMLSRLGTHNRVAVTAVRCPTCGIVKIYSGGVLLHTWNLASSTTGITSWVSPLMTSRYGTVALKVASSGKPVTIDAIGMAR